MLRNITISTLLFATSALVAQASFSESFFMGERKAILKACAGQARSMKPRDARLLAECGRYFMAGGDPKSAEEAFLIATTLEPKDGKVLRLMGLAQLKQGQRKEALATYDLIISRDPGNKEAIGQVVVDLAEAGFANEANRYAQISATLDSGDWHRFIEFGRAFLVGGRRKEAASWFSRACILKPGEEKVYLEVAKAFAEAGH